MTLNCNRVMKKVQATQVCMTLKGSPHNSRGVRSTPGNIGASNIDPEGVARTHGRPSHHRADAPPISHLRLMGHALRGAFHFRWTFWGERRLSLQGRGEQTLKIAIKREPCKLACKWSSVSDLSKASPLSSRSVRRTCGRRM